MPSHEPYLLAGHATELDRLQLQSRVWEPAGRALAARLSRPPAPRALDVGCGVLGWLRVLSGWAGPAGTVVGTDIDEQMLARARALVASDPLPNVALQQDDLFASRLPPASFDLVHARFQLAPLGRADEQLAIYRRLARPGAWIVLEEPDASSWRVHPDAPGVARLVDLIQDGFRAGGGDFSIGRRLPGLLGGGREAGVDAHVVALPAGHPYLRLPLQFAAALRPRLEGLVGATALDALLAQVEGELAAPSAWGTTFTLIQAWARAS